MSKNYNEIFDLFKSKKCKLLTTCDEFNEIVKNSYRHNFKLNYIASCGHNHNVYYNVFKSRDTGVICPPCRHKLNSNLKKEFMKNDKISKIIYIEQEYNVIKKLENIVENNFNFIKAFDGCKVDIIYKPKTILSDEWVGIQVKTSNKINVIYSFCINKTYENCLILLYCCEDENMWLIPENIINKKKISIGLNKSKYDIYNVKKDNIINKLSELYNNSNKFDFKTLNTPQNVYQRREQNFREFREQTIKFIQFHYNQLEGTVYDFKINGLKIQEKISNVVKNHCIFFLRKNKGKINGKQNKTQYSNGDNDFYWLNSEKRDFFLVIPEKILIDHDYIGNENKEKYILKITFNEVLHHKMNWLQSYLFNYKTINEEFNKNKLLCLLGITPHSS
jgi:hypothetical protein